MAIQSVMQESRIFPPPAEFASKARLGSMDAYNAMCKEAEADYAGFWAKHARAEILWKKPFTKTLDESKAPFYKWFEDGLLNVSYNCLDRHVEAGNGDKVALIFEADSGDVTRVTYKELYHQVCRLANAIKAMGYKKGDRALIYMPMSVEGVVAMQACARLGVIHSVVFGGFSAKSLQERVVDAGATLIIAADEQCRGGKAIPLKPAVDEAFSLGGCEAVKNVIVYRRTGGNVSMTKGRDVYMTTS
jgi:acetyl-CoA synthetase